MKYDYVVVGAGLFGSTFANEAKKNGKTVLVIDRRNHIGGNCFTKNIEDINVHMYSTHVFHTASKSIFDYISQFADFNNFSLRVRANYYGKLYSMPINLMTLHQLWGVNTPEEAVRKLNSVKVPFHNPKNLEEWVLSQVGEEIYHKFIYGFTAKQWSRDPKDLPASIIKRIPIRTHFNDRWYPDKDMWEGIPIGGYTPIFEKMLNGVDVELNIDFNKDRSVFEKLGRKIVYSGAIDELFDCERGNLDYRSLRFEHAVQDGDFQGTAQVNYTDVDTPWTRIIEHKHFEFKQDLPKTVLTYEYPSDYKHGMEPFYPINDDKNNALYKQYADQVDTEKYIIGGRLGRYQYYNMDQTIANALKLAGQELNK